MAEIKPADARIRALLRLGAADPVRYRHVRLVCGSHVLSNADNWYVPDRLTPEMNRQLDETDIPFGLIVKSLGFHRVRLAASLLLSRAGRPATGAGCPAARGAVGHSLGLPFSFVIETYTADVTISIAPGR